MGRKSKRIVKDNKGEFKKFEEKQVPEEVDDDGIGNEVEPVIVGEKDGKETGVVHEPSSTAVSDSPIDLGFQEDNEEVKSEGHGEGSQEGDQPISSELSEADNIAVEGMDIGDRPDGVVQEKTVLERNTGATYKDVERIKKLNECTNFILDCLSRGIKHEFEIAAKDYDIKDIGIYVLGILNRLYKAVDLYNPDFEPEWEQGVVGEDKQLYCQYCNKHIIKPKNPRQVYCCNLCARYDNERNTTGIVQPNEAYDGTEAEMDALDWEREQKAQGAN
jgi:hypothetical protein